MTNQLALLLSVPAEVCGDGVQVRVHGTKDSPLFCLPDVCKVLDLNNPSAVADRLDEDEQVKLNMNTLSQTEGIRGNPNLTFVTEPGLYKVIMRSDKTAAKTFQRWVFHDVLPSIRKYGCYPPRHDSDPGLAAELAELRRGQELLLAAMKLIAGPQPVRLDQLITVEDRCRTRWPQADARHRRRIRDVAMGIYRERLGQHPYKLTGQPNGVIAFEREHLDVLDRAIDVVMEAVTGQMIVPFFLRTEGEGA